jgi:hypothetical protein
MNPNPVNNNNWREKYYEKEHAHPRLRGDRAFRFRADKHYHNGKDHHESGGKYY